MDEQREEAMHVSASIVIAVNMIITAALNPSTQRLEDEKFLVINDSSVPMIAVAVRYSSGDSWMQIPLKESIAPGDSLSIDLKRNLPDGCEDDFLFTMADRSLGFVLSVNVCRTNEVSWFQSTTDMLEEYLP